MLRGGHMQRKSPLLKSRMFQEDQRKMGSRSEEEIVSADGHAPVHQRMLGHQIEGGSAHTQGPAPISSVQAALVHLSPDDLQPDLVKTSSRNLGGSEDRISAHAVHQTPAGEMTILQGGHFQVTAHAAHETPVRGIVVGNQQVIVTPAQAVMGTPDVPTPGEYNVSRLESLIKRSKQLAVEANEVLLGKPDLYGVFQPLTQHALERLAMVIHMPPFCCCLQFDSLYDSAGYAERSGVPGNCEICDPFMLL